MTMKYWIEGEGLIEMTCDANPPSTPQDALRMARELVDTPSLSCRGAFARNIHSAVADPCGERTVYWSTYGALARVCRDHPNGETTSVYGPAEYALQQEGDRLAREMGADTLIDADNRFGVAVTLRAIDAAIARLDAELTDEKRMFKAADRLVWLAERLGSKIGPGDREQLIEDLFAAAEFIKLRVRPPEEEDEEEAAA